MAVSGTLQQPALVVLVSTFVFAFGLVVIPCAEAQAQQRRVSKARAAKMAPGLPKRDDFNLYAGVGIAGLMVPELANNFTPGADFVLGAGISSGRFGLDVEVQLAAFDSLDGTSTTTPGFNAVSLDVRYYFSAERQRGDFYLALGMGGYTSEMGGEGNPSEGVGGRLGAGVDIFISKPAAKDFKLSAVTIRGLYTLVPFGLGPEQRELAIGHMVGIDVIFKFGFGGL